MDEVVRQYLREEVIPVIERLHVGFRKRTVIGDCVLGFEARHAEGTGCVLAGEKIVGFALSVCVCLASDIEYSSWGRYIGH